MTRPTRERLAEIRASDAAYGPEVPIGGSIQERRELLAEVDALRALIEGLVAAIPKQWRESARCLRSEVARGIAIRQSAEDKLARAEALESNADTVERLLGQALVSP